MSQQQLILLALSLSTTAALGVFPVFRSWWKAAMEYKTEALLLTLLFIGLLFLGGVREAGATSLLDPLRIARIVLYTFITGVSLLTFILSPKQKTALSSAMLFMAVYGLLAMATAAYSVYPPLTLWKGFEVITHVSVAAVMARRVATIEDANKIYSLVWLIIAYLVASFLWGAVLYPDAAFRPFLDNTGRIANEGTFGSGLRGTFPRMHLNSVTQIGAIMGVAAVSYLASYQGKRRKPVLFLLLASLMVVLLGHSRTSIFAFVLALIVMAMYVKHRGIRIGVLAGGAAIGITAAVSGVVTEYLLRGQTAEQFSSLTGRLPFWDTVIGAIMDSPVIGYGFYAGTRILFNLPGVDNTYLNVMMGGGIILLVIFLAPIAITAWNIYVTRPSRTPGGQRPAYQLLWMQTAGLFIMLFLRSLSGPSFDANHFNLILFLVSTIGAATLVRNRRLAGTQAEPSADTSTPDPAAAAPDRILRRRKTG